MASSSKRVGGEYGSVRANIDVESLQSYLSKEFPAMKQPMEIKQFKFGQSNPTYFLTDAKKKLFVLRKKPAGGLLSKTAHQVEREYQMLKALHEHNIRPATRPEQRVPVPEPYILCEDNSVIGTSFYIMEYVDGRIFTDPKMPGVSSKDRRECWLAAVQALAALSSVTPASVGLSNFGPSSDYFPRQIKSLSKVSEAQAATRDVDTNEPVGKIPLYEELTGWYRQHLPDEKKFGSRIVHGDYKLDNLVFHPTESKVIGILDWELCTLGSPLIDFVNLTLPWSVSPKYLPPGTHVAAFKDTPDVPITVDELEQEYCKLMKQPYPIKELVFAKSWIAFRTAIILQGIAARVARRQASSEVAQAYAKSFGVFGQLARVVLEDNGVHLDTRSRL